MYPLGALFAASIVWSLNDSSGNRRESGNSPTALVFMAPDCMMSERSRPLLNALQAKYQAEHVAFFAVIAGRWPREAVARLRLDFPILLDPDLKLTRQTGAHVTPEAFMLDRRGAVVYRGRVDGVSDALEDVVAGRPVRRPWLRAAGCAISTPTAVPVANAPGFHESVAPVCASIAWSVTARAAARRSRCIATMTLRQERPRWPKP